MEMSIEVINRKRAEKQVLFWMLTIQLILLYLPILQFFSIQTDNGSIPASACYFFSLLFVPYLITHLKLLRLPPWYFTVLYVYIMLLAALRIPQYGLSKSVLHWSFGFYLLVIILNAGVDLKKEDWLRILEIGACVFAMVRFAYLLFQFDTVHFLLKGYFWGEVSGYNGALLSSLTRGGRNLDATWLSLGAFFVHGKKKPLYVTFAIFFSFLGCSRVGVIAIGLAILWSLLYDQIYKLTKKTIKWYVIYAAVMLMLLFVSGLAQTFFARMFTGIQAPGQWLRAQELFVRQETVIEEAELKDSNITASNITESNITLQNANRILNGRAAMWEKVPQMVKANPFGYGVGNAVRIMRMDYGFLGSEDVIHNVFFQWLVDEGILGGAAYLGLLAAFLYRQWKNRPYIFQSPFDGFFAAWFVLAFVQFHGAEALMIYVLGCFLLWINVKPIEKGWFFRSKVKRKLSEKQ